MAGRREESNRDGANVVHSMFYVDYDGMIHLLSSSVVHSITPISLLNLAQ